jgi:hypothetical protein
MARGGDDEFLYFRDFFVNRQRFGVVGGTRIIVKVFLLLWRRCVITGGCSSTSKSGVSLWNRSILSKAGDEDILVLLKIKVFRAGGIRIAAKI